MNLSELIFPLVFIGFIGLLALPTLTAEQEQHDHRQQYVPMNNVKGTHITVCIVEGDTMQVAYPNTNPTHIDYD